MDQTENLYNPATISDAANFFGIAVDFSESGEYVTISTQAPEQPEENGRNYRFWQWFFNVTMRNLLMMGQVHSCKFLPPQEELPLSGGPVEAAVGPTLSVRRGILLGLTGAEFNRLKKSQGVPHNLLEEVKGSAHPHRLHLRGNILNVRLKK